MPQKQKGPAPTNNDNNILQHPDENKFDFTSCQCIALNPESQFQNHSNEEPISRRDPCPTGEEKW